MLIRVGAPKSYPLVEPYIFHLAVVLIGARDITWTKVSHQCHACVFGDIHAVLNITEGLLK